MPVALIPDVFSNRARSFDPDEIRNDGAGWSEGLILLRQGSPHPDRFVPTGRPWNRVIWVLPKEKDRMQRLASLVTRGSGFLLVFAAFAGQASAAPAVPEIDPGSMTSALALLTGGVLLLTDRLRRK